MRWALFFLAEYTNLVAVSALAATLFFGGGQGTGCLLDMDNYQNLIMLVFMWMKWTFPRITWIT